MWFHRNDQLLHRSVNNIGAFEPAKRIKSAATTHPQLLPNPRRRIDNRIVEIINRDVPVGKDKLRGQGPANGHEKECRHHFPRFPAIWLEVKRLRVIRVRQVSISFYYTLLQCARPVVRLMALHPEAGSIQFGHTAGFCNRALQSLQVILHLRGPIYDIALSSNAGEGLSLRARSR